MIKYGFSTIGCPNLDIDSVLELCNEYKLDFIELRALGGNLDILDYFQKTRMPEDMSRVRVFASSYTLLGENEERREKLYREAAFADRIGAKYIRIFGAGGSRTDNDLSRTQIEAAAKNVDVLRGEFANRKISCELILETHDVLSYSKTCHALNQCLDVPISILWDSYHTWRHGKESPEETWSLLGYVIKHIHYKDGILAADTPEAVSGYTLPGRGHYPLSELKQVLQGAKYDDGVSLEWEKLWHAELPEIREALNAFVGIFSLQ